MPVPPPQAAMAIAARSNAAASILASALTLSGGVVSGSAATKPSRSAPQPVAVSIARIAFLGQKRAACLDECLTGTLRAGLIGWTSIFLLNTYSLYVELYSHAVCIFSK